MEVKEALCGTNVIARNRIVPTNISVFSFQMIDGRGDEEEEQAKRKNIIKGHPKYLSEVYQNN